MQDCSSEAISPTSTATTCTEPADAAADRAYLIETATPGYTMVLQGTDVAIERLHPEFVHRLAGAIREARAAGLSTVGIFSAYRPPAFGVGGFSDKFNSLHSYGLAVDMTGIGTPGSVDAKTWYDIAARHGVVCPYGVENAVEWNHCQPTSLKIVRTENPLRETITAEGPVSLESMFEAGNAVIDSPPENPINQDRVTSTLIARAEALGNRKADLPRGECRSESKSGCSLETHLTAATRSHAVLVAQATTPHGRCHEEARSRASGCTSRDRQTAERRGTHARQTAARGVHENHRA